MLHKDAAERWRQHPRTIGGSLFPEVLLVILDVLLAVSTSGFSFVDVFDDVARLALEELAERIDSLDPERADLARLDPGNRLHRATELIRQLNRLHLLLNQELVKIKNDHVTLIRLDCFIIEVL